MNAERNEAKTRRLYEAVWNERRLELIDDWVTTDFVGYWSTFPEPVHGPAGFRAAAQELLSAVPDARFTVEDTVAAGDRVVARVRVVGTHDGPMHGFAPTGKPVDMQYIAIERYGDAGRCVEEWVRADDLAIARQIGALPPPGSAAEKLGQRLFALRAARMRRA